MTRLEALVRSDRVNAGIGWVAVAALVATAAVNVVTNDPLWGGLALVVAGVTAVPAAAAGDWTVVVPWPLPVAAAGTVAARTAGFAPDAAGAVTVTALALVVVTELDAFTAVDMSRRFAVAFAALTTMAMEAVWTVAQFYSDRWLGTSLLGSETALQVDFVVVTAVAVGLSAAFEGYTRSVGHVGTKHHPGGGEEA